MNATAHHTYRRAARAGLSGRALEAAVLGQLALELERSVSTAVPDVDSLTAAVQRNRTFWALVGGDVAGPGSPLPVALRSDLQALCAFALRQGVRALVDPRAETVLPLARVNRLVADGLASRPDAPPSAASPAAATRRA